jgi:SAM-dependent methyltransferase
MPKPESLNGGQNLDSPMWRGIDFSGITVVVGAGTGRLLEVLLGKVAAARGNLVVISQRGDALQSLDALRAAGPLTLLQARSREIPVRDGTVDLLALSGVLREVPENRLVVVFEEIWRALVPGGQLRISDIIEPSEADYNRAWSERNRLVRKLAHILDRPTALSVELRQVAQAARSVGFENLGVTVLPGFSLTDAWIEDTVNALRTMAGRVADRSAREEILNHDLPRLVAAYNQGDQRAAERFVLRGTKIGDLALDMEASFTEDDLLGPE